MAETEQLFADRYRLGERLGVGGMSTVQLAFDTRLERNVAVKLLAEHLAADSNFVARFRREALSAARLVHPNVVQVYDFGTDEASGRQFIVMEHVEGNSCAELLRDQGRLPVAEVVDIVGQACRGLDYAHRNGVVHRDVKPGNLLRNRDGVVKLADFGIAKAAEDSDITRVGSVIGTAAYLSPEQARGEPAQAASDLYALGVVTYQLITGRLPYRGASLTDLARQQESGPPTALHEVVTEVPPALSAAVMRALHGDPRARYEDAPEMERALRDGLRGIAPPPLDAAPTYELRSEDATRLLGDDATAATRALAAERPRRRMEPLPAELAPPRRPHPAPIAPAPLARRRPRWGRRIFAFTVLAAAVAAVVYGVVAWDEITGRTTQLREISGDLRQTFDDLETLIRDNIR